MRIPRMTERDSVCFSAGWASATLLMMYAMGKGAEYHNKKHAKQAQDINFLRECVNKLANSADRADLRAVLNDMEARQIFMNNDMLGDK